MGSVVQLSQKSSHLLCSGNIITSVFSAVKELLENSLDAKATNVEVRLDNYGFDKIEVRDNGAGIKKCDVEFVAKPNFTSKIISFSDLEELTTYGFRGEALSAICSMSDMSITTKTADEDFSMTYILDKNGDIRSSKPSAAASGTSIIACNLFGNFPVRRKYCKTDKNKRDELKKIEDLLCAYSCAHLTTRFSLYHHHNVIWSKTSTPEMKGALIQVLGCNVFNSLQHKKQEFEGNICLEGYFPKKPAFANAFRLTPDRTIILVNKRPVKIKSIEKILQDIFCKSEEGQGEPKGRYPICLLSISVATSQVDVNVDPNKLKVLLHNHDNILQLITEFLNTTSPDSHRESTLNVPSTNPSVSFQLFQSQNFPSPKTKNGVESQMKSQKKTGHCRLSRKNGPSSQQKQLVQSQLLNDTSNQSSTLFGLDVTPIPQNDKEVTPNPATSFLNLSSKTLVHQQLPSSVATNVGNVLVEPNLGTHSVSQIQMQAISSLPAVNPSSLEDTVLKVTTSEISSNGNIFGKGPNTVQHALNKNTLDTSSNQVLKEGQMTEETTNAPPVLIDEPVAVLIPNKKRRLEMDEADKSKSQVNDGKIRAMMNKKSFTAFDVFCRSKRQEVVEANPNLSHKEIANNLFEIWKTLSLNEKQKYSQIALNKSSNQGQRQERPKPSKRNDGEMVSFDYNKFCQYFSSINGEMPEKSNDQVLKERQFTPFKMLSSGVWIFSENNRLGLLNTYRMQEMLLYHRLLETYQLKPQLLPNPILLVPENVGGPKNYETLTMLCMKEGSVDISNANLTSNGFDVRFSSGAIHLTGLASSVPGYNLHDLAEVLQMLQDNSETSLPVSKCRPSKLVQYLQGEAVRIARQSLPIQKSNELFDLLKQSQKYLADCSTCFHNKPFKHYFQLDLSDLE